MGGISVDGVAGCQYPAVGPDTFVVLGVADTVGTVHKQMCIRYSYTGDASFISDCTVENARDKNDMTTLYCGMTATDGPMMFELSLIHI